MQIVLSNTLNYVPILRKYYRKSRGIAALTPAPIHGQGPAQTRHILLQFLVEAVTLSLLGGIVGIVLGLAASLLISHFANWSTQVSFLSTVMAFVFSALVGVFFGYYPARKAAFMDPIEALRYE
jgi:ABC-type lipoprotein release transport system permease subunit